MTGPQAPSTTIAIPPPPVIPLARPVHALPANDEAAMQDYMARVAKVQAELAAARAADTSSAPEYDPPIIFDDSPTDTPTPELLFGSKGFGNLPPAVDDSQLYPQMTVALPTSPPAATLYQFDATNALIAATGIGLAGFVFFIRRRLKWLAQRVFSNLVEFIRWLHMPPDDKI